MSRVLEGERLFRRDFLKVSLAVGATVVLNGCEKPPLPAVFTPEIKGLPPLTETEVKDAAKIALVDFNRVLDLGLKESEVVPNVSLIQTLPEYQKILAAEIPTYVPQEEINRWAITTNQPNSPSGEKIFVYKPGIENVTKLLPNTEQGKRGRIEFLVYVLGHEYVHFSATLYKSEVLHNEVFGRIFANIPSLKGKKVAHEGVRGAIVYGDAESRKVNAFESVEEAEAILINDLIIRRRGRPQVARPPDPNELGHGQQIKLYNDLLSKVFLDAENGLKILAKLRMEMEGREKFLKMIGEKFNIPPQDQLFFSLSIMYAINQGDENLYRHLVNRPIQN